MIYGCVSFIISFSKKKIFIFPDLDFFFLFLFPTIKQLKITLKGREHSTHLRFFLFSEILSLKQTKPETEDFTLSSPFLFVLKIIVNV